MPALDVLDLAFQHHHGWSPDFTDEELIVGREHTDPRTAFGRMLRDAFAPEIRDAEIRKAVDFADPVPCDELFVSRWEERVMQRLAQRYLLRL